MKTIYKYELKLGTITPTGYYELKLPQGAKVLHVGAQGSSQNPFLWVFLDTDKPLVKFWFGVYATGEKVGSPDDLYLGTAVCTSDVWHVYTAYL